MSFELNLDNYDYHDLASLFQLKGYGKNPIAIEKKCRVAKAYSPEVHAFFVKAGKIIECIHEMVYQNKIQTNEACMTDLMYVILKIPSFETMEVNELIRKLQPPIPDLVTQVHTVPISHGKLNSIQRIVQTQNLHLHSCFRQYPSLSTDYDYILPVEMKHVASMRLASIELPNTRSLFSSRQQNNTFTIQMDSKEYNIVIPDGNYTSETLQDYLNTTYFYSLAIHFYITPQFHTVIESHAPMSVFFGGCGWILGFRNPCYIHTMKVESEGLFDAIGDRYVYLCVEDYQYNTNPTNLVGLEKSYMDKSILAKIPIHDEKFSLIIHDTNPLCKTRLYNGPVTLKKLHIRLLDKFGYVIDLNQMDFSFTLELDLIYENF